METKPKEISNFASYEEARRVVIEEGVSQFDYKSRYKDISKKHNIRLPSNPNITYADIGWVGWGSFLGLPELKEIASYVEARRVVIEEGVFTKLDYKSRYKDISSKHNHRLPSQPEDYYKEWSGWNSFLDREFTAYEEARRVVKKEGVVCGRDYRSRYKDISKKHNIRLPCRPERTYADSGWVGSSSFFIQTNKSSPEARIHSELEYVIGSSAITYRNKKVNISEIDIYFDSLKLGIEYDGSFWHSQKVDLDIAKNQACEKQEINLFRVRENTSRHKLEKINQENDVIYKKEKEQLLDVIKKLMKKIALNHPLPEIIKNNILEYQKTQQFKNQEKYDSLIYFATYEEVQKIVIGEGVVSQFDYKSRYKEIAKKHNLRLPSKPEDSYKEWNGWGQFLNTEFASYEEARRVVIAEEVRNNLDYKSRYKDISKKHNIRLPSTPQGYYKEWSGWGEFLSKPTKKSKKKKRNFML